MKNLSFKRRVGQSTLIALLAFLVAGVFIGLQASWNSSSGWDESVVTSAAGRGEN